MMAETDAPKQDVFLSRYIVLAGWVHTRFRVGPDPAHPVLVTVAELAHLWGCSDRATRQSLARLQSWGLLSWEPQAGRARRSFLVLLTHPVHVYYERARRAQADGDWAEAAFWLQEILTECPCIPDVPRLLADVRGRLGLPLAVACC